MDGGAWWAVVRGVAKSRTRLSNFTFTFHFHALEKEMATHSSVLAWRIPGTEEPGRRLSMGLHRVGHDWSDLAAVAPAWIIHICCKNISSLKQTIRISNLVFKTKLLSHMCPSVVSPLWMLTPFSCFWQKLWCNTSPFLYFTSHIYK